MRYGDVSGDYVASIGTDGNLNIYKFKNNSKKEVKHLSTLLASVDPIEDTSNVSFLWLPESSGILIGGSKEIKLASPDEDDESKWEFIVEDKIKMEHSINSVLGFSEEVLLTYSQKSGHSLVWRLGEEGGETIGEFKTSKPIISMRLNKEAEILAFMDNECRVGIFSTKEPEVKAVAEEKSSQIVEKEV